MLIGNKGFKDLWPPEVAEMIEVHLGADGCFDPRALYEFTEMNYGGGLEAVRKEVVAIDHQFATSPNLIDGTDAPEGRAALAKLAARLRQQNSFRVSCLPLMSVRGRKRTSAMRPTSGVRRFAAALPLRSRRRIHAT